jgi:hypothetical protein
MFAEVNDEHLNKSILFKIGYGLSKYLKEKGQIGINVDVELTACKEVFKAVVIDLKRKGFASTEEKPPISQQDLSKMYCEGSISLNINTPSGLQRNVWLDLMFCSCRCGQENLRYMTNTTFDVHIRVITTLRNSEQSYKGKVKAHKHINRPNQSTTGKL